MVLLLSLSLLNDILRIQRTDTLHEISMKRYQGCCRQLQYILILTILLLFNQMGVHVRVLFILPLF